MREQGLLAACFLLAIEVIFVGSLYHLLQDAENEAKKLDRARDVLSKCNRLTELIFLMAKDGSKYTVAPSPQLHQEFNHAADESGKILKNLRDAQRSSPEESNKIEQVQADLRKAVSLARDALDFQPYSADTLEHALANFKLTREVRIAADVLNSHIMELSEHERQVEAQTYESQRRSRAGALNLLMFFLAVNILAAVLAATVFMQRIVSRVGKIVENAEAMKSGAPLNPLIGGTDEIATLDAVFHSMADALKAEQSALKSEKELVEQSEERLRRMIEMMPIGLVVLKSVGDETIIEYANPKLLSILQYDLDEVAGQPFGILIASQQGKEQYLPFAEPETAPAREIICKCKSGATRHFELSSSEMRTITDARRLLTMLDITEKMEIQRMRQAFVSIVSHELRTPLTSIRGFLSFLSMGVFGKLPDKVVDSATRAESNTERLIHLVNDLLDLEKIESGHVRLNILPVQISEIFQSARDGVEEMARQREVTVEMIYKDQSIAVDRDRMIQVFVNLLSNAIKHSSPGSSVIIQHTPLISVHEFSVKDEGPGIAPSEQLAIFERFYQSDAKDQTDGTGLGLPICRAIVEQHGGVMGVSSEPGHGARFWFKLPIYTRERNLVDLTQS